MAEIYRKINQPLDELLHAATCDSATLQIPDLQRPYVWSPSQVTLLVDSLIKGWPIGTFLIWKIYKDDAISIPSKTFGNIIDRTSENTGSYFSGGTPPSDYLMVLDGQQRFQSLILAFYGDDSGFKLYDRDWRIETTGKKTKAGRKYTNPWCKGSLYINLDAFLNEYNKYNKKIQAIDFNNVLNWLIGSPKDGFSPNYDKNTQPILPCAYDDDNKGRFIRLSRLWNLAKNNPEEKESFFQNALKNTEETTNYKFNDDLLSAMGELMTTLIHIVKQEISYLELRPYRFNKENDENSYSYAVVNIFTRLNTAGRTLTREEIIFAWLKTGWINNNSHKDSARECFNDLKDDMKNSGLSIDIDQLVNAVSFVWSVIFNDGKILSDKELLNADTIKRMAECLSNNWQSIVQTFLAGAEIIKERDLEFGSSGRFSSLNSLNIILGWLFIAKISIHSRNETQMVKYNHDKSIENMLLSYIDRWLICSQWAGIWGRSTGVKTQEYANKLNMLLNKCNATNNLNDKEKYLGDFLAEIVKDLEVDAKSYIDDLKSENKSNVSQFRTPLWVWHRLNIDRWKMSQITLKIKKKKTYTEIDHIVSTKLWDELIKKTNDEESSALSLSINMLGNCSLLEKSFNISKGRDDLNNFLKDVYEFKENIVDMNQWSNALEISKKLSEPSKNIPKDIIDEIEKRTDSICEELLLFIEGQKNRVDCTD